MITNNQAAKMIGLKPVSLRKFRMLGLIAEHGKLWSLRQVLGLAIKTHSRAAGASKAASDQAFRILATADLAKLREAIAGGHRFLRLMGDVCDDRLVTEKAAFDPKLLRIATETRTPLVIADVSHWLEVIDAELERTAEQTAPLGVSACKS